MYVERLVELNIGEDLLKACFNRHIHAEITLPDFHRSHLSSSVFAGSGKYL